MTGALELPRPAVLSDAFCVSGSERKWGTLPPVPIDGVRRIREKAAGPYCSSAEVLTFWHTRLTWRACWVEKKPRKDHPWGFFLVNLEEGQKSYF